jgi:hypothetical protein
MRAMRTTDVNAFGTKVLVVVLILALMASCTRYVEIPESEYTGTQESNAGHWRVVTVDGSVVPVARFSSTDSTIVVEELDRSAGRARGTKTQITVPYGIDKRQIRTIERVDSPGRAGDLVVILGIVGVATIATLIIFHETAHGFE